jgi:magnesium-transporting ATPase (P-type)
MQVEYYKKDQNRRLLYILTSIASLGTLAVVGSWFPRVKTRISMRKIGDGESLLTANVALMFQEASRDQRVAPAWNLWAKLMDAFKMRGSWIACTVEHFDLSPSLYNLDLERDLQTSEEDVALLDKSNERVVCFEYLKERFVYTPNQFVMMPATLEAWVNSGFFTDKIVDNGEANKRKLVNGTNSLQPPMTPISQAISNKVLAPFYVFQVFACVVWMIETYYTFAILILLMSTVSVVTEIWMQRSNELKLRLAAKLSDGDVCTERGSLPSQDLVVGDIVYINAGLVSADLQLLEGSCIVDESSLTGEATPVVRMATGIGKSKSLLAGSQVLQVESTCKAQVIATGFSTQKGVLFRQLLHPTPLPTNQLEDSALPFLILLILVGILGFVKRVLDGINRGQAIGYLVLTSLDFLTIAVPPMLPIVLTLSNAASVARLLRKNIYCINPGRIAWSAGVDVIAWDKTGTLTEAAPRHVQLFSADERSELVMATAQGLAQLNGVLVGPSLDLEMFNWTGSHLLDGKVQIREELWDILQKWEFDSLLQRTSSLIYHGSNSYRITCKGAPDSILDICTTESLDAKGGREKIESEVARLGMQGEYILALAIKQGGFPKITRVEAERDLEFVGLMSMRNAVKHGVKSVISELQLAGIENVMITGDGLETALSVAKQIGMTSGQEVIVGGPMKEMPREAVVVNAQGLRWIMDVLEKDVDHWSRDLIYKARVFARVKPFEKTWLVKMMANEKTVCMVGDGANDLGALRAAHVGVAFSDAGIAGFTSKARRVEDVIEIIREGQCAMESAISAFQFMLLYPAIQLTMAFYLQHINSNMSQNQYFFDDLFLVVPTQLFLLSLGPRANGLTREKPPRTLFDVRVLMSLFGMLIVWLIMFISVVVLMNTAGGQAVWFCPVSNPCYSIKPDDLRWGFVLRSMENTVVWSFGHFQFIIVGICLVGVVTFRRSVWREIWSENYEWFWWGYSWLYVLYVVAAWTLATLMLFVNEESIALWPSFRQLFELREGVPLEFRGVMYGLAILDLWLSIVAATSSKWFGR